MVVLAHGRTLIHDRMFGSLEKPRKVKLLLVTVRDLQVGLSPNEALLASMILACSNYSKFFCLEVHFTILFFVSFCCLFQYD